MRRRHFVRIEARVATVAALAVVLSGCAPCGLCSLPGTGARVRLIPGVHRPEDVEFVASAGLVLVSENPGDSRPGDLAALDPDGLPPTPRRLWPTGAATDYDDGDRRALDPSCGLTAAERADPAAWFAPHGIATAPRADGGVTVVAVDHGRGRETVDVFDLRDRGAAARLVWRGCVSMPSGTRGNDLAVDPEGNVYVGDYHGPLGPLFALLGLRKGGVFRWDATARPPADPWRKVAGATDARAANGLLVDGATLYYADTGAGTVVAVKDGVPRATYRVGGLVDNLSRRQDGHVLVASHRHTREFLWAAIRHGAYRSAWAVADIDPHRAPADAVSCLVSSEDAPLGVVSSIAFDGRRYYLGAVYGEALGIWEPAQP